MIKEKKYKFDYTIDTADWGSGCEMDREKCEEALSEWFDNLSLKTKIAIYYSQKLWETDEEIGIDTMNECPWGKMVWDAEIRIKERHAPYSLKVNGHNLSLWIESITHD
tara:strand:- start:36 stop:362 length:327 start_codon:yes stop_codon:yes gene_type:complete